MAAMLHHVATLVAAVLLLPLLLLPHWWCPSVVQHRCCVPQLRLQLLLRWLQLW